MVASVGCASYSTVPVNLVPSPTPALLGPVDARKTTNSSTETWDGPLSLQKALEIALRNHPELGVAAASTEIAQGNVIQAGLYPNPTIGYIGEQVGSKGNAMGQQGPFVSQEIVTGGKLENAQTAAQQAVTVTQWQAITKRFLLEAKLRTAFYEVLTAERELKEIDAAVKIAQENLDIAKKLELINGKLEVMRANVDLEANLIKQIAGKNRLLAATPLLANAMGVPASSKLITTGDLEAPKPEYDASAMREIITSNHSEVMAAQAGIAEAEQLITKARLQNIPNLQLKAQPLYDYTEQVAQASFEVGVTIPVWNKNQGNILAADAEVNRRRHELDTIKLRLTEQLVQAGQRYETAKEQTLKYEKELIPQAKEVLRVTKIAFQNGEIKDYNTLLDAQRTVAQARINYAQSLGEFWKAVAELEALLQRP